MKRVTFFLLYCLLCISASFAQGFGKATLFNNDWKFILDDNPKFKEAKFNDAGWRQLTLPHDWSIEAEPSQQWASCTGYLPGGIGWYRKHFSTELLDKALLSKGGYDRGLYIYFEGVYNRSEVYLNGHLLGKRPNGYASFMYDLTPYLKKGDNVLAVRVDHSRYADSRWYTGSGIYRDVWMVSAPKTHLAQWGTTYRLKQLNANGSADVEVDIAIDNIKKGHNVSISLSDAKGSIVAQQTQLAQDKQTLLLTIPNAQLWDLKNPYLYTLKVELNKEGTKIDETEIAVGLRTLRFDADEGFFLNGQNMKVKGVCLHHDAGVLGAAVPREVWMRRVQELKHMGANAIRMSHNPQAPMLYDICDQLGMLVMDEASDEWEFPKRKWVEGWNQGKPAFDGTYDFFEEWIDRDVTDMVRRDRNHPSVFLWSVGNEVDYPNDPYSHPVLDGGNAAINQPMFGGYKPDAPNAERIGKIAKRIAADIRAIDTSRPVTGALAGVVMSNQTEYPEAVDVVGYNYTENRYDIDHEQYPERVIYGSETGVGYDAWKAVRDRQHIFGQFIWTGTDYLGESGRWPSRGLNTGLLDFASFRKPRGWFRASLWSEEPVCYIGTYPIPRMRDGENERMRTNRMRNFLSADAEDNWPPIMPRRRNATTEGFHEGDLVRVVCYTNAPQARLLLNDSIVGQMQQRPDSTGIIHWDIPYHPGTLRAEGCDQAGNVVSSYEIVTYSEATALHITPLAPLATNEVSQLLVEVTDKDGNLVKSSRDNIQCQITGPARLLGLENCNPTDMGYYPNGHRPAHRGSLVAYIQRTKKGPVTVTFTAQGLESTSFRLE